jgi:hypothetical protein
MAQAAATEFRHLGEPNQWRAALRTFAAPPTISTDVADAILEFRLEHQISPLALAALRQRGQVVNRGSLAAMREDASEAYHAGAENEVDEGVNEQQRHVVQKSAARIRNCPTAEVGWAPWYRSFQDRA